MTSDRRTFGIDFIDPLFAVAVHLGLVEGLAVREWFRDGRLPSGDEWFPFLVFVLGLLTLVLSWVGYHQSVTTKPLNGGFARFVIDILLVGLYAVLMMQIDHFGVVILGLVLVYALFALWDMAKNREYPSPDQGSVRREWVTFAFLGLFVALAVGYFSTLLSRELTLAGAFLLTILYRAAKEVVNGLANASVSKFFFGVPS